MKLRYILLFALCAVVSASCSKMNDNIDQYLSQGEIIYIARPDSVKLYAGKDRFKAEFWMSDPRATEMRIYWAQKTDSLVVPIPESRDITEPISVVTDSNMPEDQYTLYFVTFDNLGNRSVNDEQNVSVYGTNFQNSLNNRMVDSKSVSGNKVTINWGNCYSTKEIGIRVWYTDISGAAKNVTYQTETLGTTSVIDSVDATKEVSYSTMYLPEPTAIDTFFTARTVIAF